MVLATWEVRFYAPTQQLWVIKANDVCSKRQESSYRQQHLIISYNWTSIFMAGLPLIVPIYEFDKWLPLPPSQAAKGLTRKARNQPSRSWFYIIKLHSQFTGNLKRRVPVLETLWQPVWVLNFATSLERFFFPCNFFLKSSLF